MSDLLRAPLDHCYWNPRKGMWETHPAHWAQSKPVWVMVAFLWATTLERGVRS